MNLRPVRAVSSVQGGVCGLRFPLCWRQNHLRGTRMEPSRCRWGPVSPGGLPWPSGGDVPATLATRRASWFLGVLERFWLRCLLPAERVLRRWTSVALKKATMKGCLFWGPCRPIRPASLGLMLCPRPEAAKCTGEWLQGRGQRAISLVPHGSRTPWSPRRPACVCSAPPLCQAVSGAWTTVGTTRRNTPVPWVCVRWGCVGGKHGLQVSRGESTKQGRERNRAEAPATGSFTHISLGKAGHVSYLISGGGRNLLSSKEGGDSCQPR